jgi:hypothetical protein
MSVSLPQRWLDKAGEDLVVGRLVMMRLFTHMPFFGPAVYRESSKGLSTGQN